MKTSKRGQTFESGKSLSTDLRRSIIDEIVLGGGNVITGYFPGHYKAVASRFCVARSTVRKIWKRYCEVFSEEAQAKGGANRNREKLMEEDLELIKALKVRRGSITLREICDELQAIGGIDGNISSSTICRIIRNKMPSGKPYSRKKVTRLAKERFTHTSMVYTRWFVESTILVKRHTTGYWYIVFYCHK